MRPIPFVDKQLMDAHGIVFDGVKGFYEPKDLAMSFSMACDAQPEMVTATNAGIPAFLTNWLDPQMIQVIVTPMKAAAIFGETKKGDWTTQTAMFPIVESTGEVSSYGDYNTNGQSNSNVNWANRQSYLFQTTTQWGELELARAGEAKINYAANLNVASALTLGKFLNKTYFYGVSGIECRGLLNDPDLPSSIVPTTKTAGGTTWAAGTAAEITTDIKKLFVQAQSQLGGNLTMEDPMTLAMSPLIEAELLKSAMYTNISVADWLKKSFPNMTVKTAVEYNTGSGQLIQLIVDKVNGQDTGYCAFNEKMRAHAIVIKESSFSQKKTSGTWGAIARFPVGIASMLGV